MSEVSLTPTEARIYAMLAESPGVPVQYERIGQELGWLWPGARRAAAMAPLRSHLRNLRRKLPPDVSISTIRQCGVVMSALPLEVAVADRRGGRRACDYCGEPYACVAGGPHSRYCPDHR